MRKPDIPASACNDDGEWVRSFEVDGKEYPDSTPMEIPLGSSRPPSLQEIMKALIRTEVSREADAQHFETFEEAGDFDIEDDPLDPLTPWEALFEVPPQDVKEGGTPPQEAAAPSAASQTSSAGSASGASPVSTEQKPIGAGAVPSAPVDDSRKSDLGTGREQASRS